MSKELPPSRTAEQFVVRFPDGMRDRIKEAADANNRSMNAEIVDRLEASLDPQNNPAALRQKMLEMEGDAALEALRTSKTKSDLMAAQFLVIQMAKACPPDTIPKESSLRQLIDKILEREGEIMQEAIANMIDSLLNLKGAMDKRVESGQLKVVPHTEGPTAFSEVIGGLKALKISTQELNELVASKPKN